MENKSVMNNFGEVDRGGVGSFEATEEKKESVSGITGEFERLADKRCKKCKGKGQTVGALGVVLRCSCTFDKNNNVVEVKKVNNEKKTSEIMIKKLGLVPGGREKDNFDVDALQQRMIEEYVKNGYVVKNYNDYEELLTMLLAYVEHDRKIPSSYLIGAPNGMSKTTFANHLIRLGHSKGLRMVPYVSLMEIYDKYRGHLEKSGVVIKQSVSDSVQTEEEERYCGECSEIIREYKWNDFVNCDILVTCLSDSMCADVEMSILKMLLKDRARMCKPTIVFLDVALASYLYNCRIKMAETFKSEYISNSTKPSFSKLKYISCYLYKKNV